MQISHPTWIEIDTAQFRKNLSVIRSLIGKSRLCLPVKANAYGHGLISIAKCAQKFVDYFGVSCLQEGVLLREAGIQTPILVLGAIHEDQIEDLAHFELEFTISSQFKADFVDKKLKTKCRVHLEVETGMQRTGVRPSTALALIEHVKAMSCFELVGVYSHLATADEADNAFAYQQIREFQKLILRPSFRGLTAHIANSGGVIHYPESHLDMVRPGLMAYGYLPVQGIAPCFSLKSKVSFFKVVESGVGIGYGHNYKTKEKTRVVTVPIGYGDGYRRSLCRKGEVLIRGKRFQISGAICMDQLMVDVGMEEIYVGDEVVLIGKQGDQEIKLTDIAQKCDTIPYEILCQFNERITRILV
jgi:alanine racemase